MQKDYLETNTAKDRPIARRNILRAFAGMGFVAAAPTYANAAGYLRGGGDIRKIALRNDRTGEMLDMVYWIEGRYVREALKEVNYFFRDWRQGRAIDVDPHEVDIIAATHRMLGTNEPYLLISGYRTPTTNRRLNGAASNSYHTKGMAADLRLGSRSVKQMSRAAKKLKSGGVGTYYRSNFVHMDSGPIRAWGG